MGLNLKGLAGSGTFPHGVHPPERKNFAEDAAIEVVPSPKKVMLPFLQHVGAPSKAAVKPKTVVAFGDPVTEAGGFVSVGHHAPIAGKVMKTGVTTLANGRHVPAVPIKADGEQLEGEALRKEILGGDWPRDISEYDPDDIRKSISAAGIVGLGGAAFPTHVKYAPNEEKPVDTVIINGAECEPYLTADYRLMVEAPDPIITGTLLLARACNAKNVVIGIEDNKPKAIEIMQKAAAGTGIQIAVVKTKYPQGSEKQLIYAISGRKVPPPPGLPLDVGVAVNNIGTAVAVARAVIRKKPLTHRVICVTGGGIKTPKNVLAPIGITMGELIEFCGGLKDNAARIIGGGPMMGFAFSDMNTPVTKGTSGITVMTKEDLLCEAETNCVRCGRCVDSCPMNLVPSKLALASRNKDIELAQQYNIMTCFECGSCAYICPAQLPIVQLVRTGKAEVIAASQK